MIKSTMIMDYDKMVSDDAYDAEAVMEAIVENYNRFKNPLVSVKRIGKDTVEITSPGIGQDIGDICSAGVSMFEAPWIIDYIIKWDYYDDEEGYTNVIELMDEEDLFSRRNLVSA